uniref:C2H2-type domain-containing protein n=1 Tax=Rhinolophus ferrumequinum TaxID=59479 RepID=A0A671EBX8_RHIFE
EVTEHGGQAAQTCSPAVTLHGGAGGEPRAEPCVTVPLVPVPHGASLSSGSQDPCSHKGPHVHFRPGSGALQPRSGYVSGGLRLPSRPQSPTSSPCGGRPCVWGWADAFGRNTCPLSCQWIPSRGKPHKCQECEKAFVQSTGLVQHQRTHTYQKPFACRERGCAFSKNSSLVKHWSIHTRETLPVQPLQQRLPEEFVPRQAPADAHRRVAIHVQPIWLHIQPELPLCAAPTSAQRTGSGCPPARGRAFANRSALPVHHRTHMGDRPDACGMCCKAFSLSSSPANHQRCHVGEQPSECRERGRAVPQSLSLANHWYVHKGEQPCACGQCRKAFCQIKFLTHHERLHTGDKSFMCGDCGRAFMQSTFLALHPKTHTR